MIATAALAEISAGVQLQKAVRSEFRLRTRSGEYLWVQGRGKAVYDEDGTPYHFAGTLTDIIRPQTVGGRAGPA